MPLKKAVLSLFTKRMKYDMINPLPPSDAVWKQKNFFKRIFFCSVFSKFKKISPLWKPEI